jgi:nucleolar pre-ribosomal-associated protein 1
MGSLIPDECCQPTHPIALVSEYFISQHVCLPDQRDHGRTQGIFSWLLWLTKLTCLEQNADMQEKPHVLYILHMLKDSLKESPEEGAPLRLPSFTTLFLSHALRGVFYPENFIYPLTAHFLLQRPELDITDVPMLYSMLYSSTDNWKRERTWILKFIADSMLSAGEEEWRVFRRRHTWDLLASLFQGSGGQDRVLRNEILEARYRS